MFFLAALERPLLNCKIDNKLRHRFYIIYRQTPERLKPLFGFFHPPPNRKIKEIYCFNFLTIYEMKRSSVMRVQKWSKETTTSRLSTSRPIKSSRLTTSRPMTPSRLTTSRPMASYRLTTSRPMMSSRFTMSGPMTSFPLTTSPMYNDNIMTSRHIVDDVSSNGDILKAFNDLNLRF